LLAFGPLYQDPEVPPYLVGNLFVHRAGVSLLLGDAELRQQRQYYAVRLFALARQLVDSNLSHTNMRPAAFDSAAVDIALRAAAAKGRSCLPPPVRTRVLS